MTEYGSLREKIAAETKARQANYNSFILAFQQAKEVGYAAGRNACPTPMVVSEHVNPLNDSSAVKQEWFVGDGACGFAWVNVSPGNCSFAKWLVKNGHARKSYYGGVDIWVHDHGQSIERKEAHAYAMVDVLKAQLGVKAYASSRMD